jgi:hypothetical protein
MHSLIFSLELVATLDRLSRRMRNQFLYFLYIKLSIGRIQEGVDIHFQRDFSDGAAQPEESTT